MQMYYNFILIFRTTY